MVELGISTFGETTEIEGTGITPTHDERIRNMVEEVKLADKVGSWRSSYKEYKIKFSGNSFIIC